MTKQVQNVMHATATVLGVLAILQWVVVGVVADLSSSLQVPKGVSTGVGIAGVVLVAVSKGVDSLNNALTTIRTAP